MKQFTTTQLKQAKKNLELAKKNRQGGLTIGEQVALIKITKELINRAE